MSIEATESRVSELRKREAAQEAWQWIVDLKERAKSDSAGAEAELDAIFRKGTPPQGLGKVVFHQVSSSLTGR